MIWKNILTQLFWSRIPLRQIVAKQILRRLDFVAYSSRLRYDAVDRPQYGFCIHRAALLAKALGIPAISVLEFGVAGGVGLLCAEQHARQVEAEVGVRIEVYGFDTGSGLPRTTDHRDLLFRWQPGFFTMDHAELETRLTRAKLILGDVKDTGRLFFEGQPAPIGAVMIDLDYYSSTVDALRIFETSPENYLPRIYCYLDDIVDAGEIGMNHYLGELAAVEEYNKAHTLKKIAKIHGLYTIRALPAIWNEKIFVHHDFGHPKYNNFVSEQNQQLVLE